MHGQKVFNQSVILLGNEVLRVELKICNFRGCWKDATSKGHIYGRHKNGTEDSFIPVVACDEHAKEKDFYRYIEQKENQTK